MKKTAAQRLVSEGFFESPEAALPYILSGEVFCGGARVTGAGQKLDVNLPLCVRGKRYVSRGGYKLEGALDAFGIDVSGRVCLDAGASTGGFTDCLVKRGAALVYAVDAGFGQLAGSLAQNPRVVNMEKTNIGDARLTRLDPAPAIGAADLSYLSLKSAVPLYRDIMRGAGDMICLVKPLFEIDDARARRTGVIEDTAYAPMLLALARELSAVPGASVIGVNNSPITGSAGTREFFFHVAFGRPEKPDLAHSVYSAVARALALENGKK